jgi:hypothetical protein
MHQHDRLVGAETAEGTLHPQSAGNPSCFTWCHGDSSNLWWLWWCVESVIWRVNGAAIIRSWNWNHHLRSSSSRVVRRGLLWLLMMLQWRLRMMLSKKLLYLNGSGALFDTESETVAK